MVHARFVMSRLEIDRIALKTKGGKRRRFLKVTMLSLVALSTLNSAGNSKDSTSSTNGTSVVVMYLSLNSTSTDLKRII